MADEEEDFEWDAEDFDPDKGFVSKQDGEDTWEGEDEGLAETQLAPEPAKPKESQSTGPKKTKKEKIEEKKAKRKEAEQATKSEEKKVQPKEDTAAEKERQLELQKEADLEVAKDLFGVTEQPLKVQEAVTIDSMNPTTVEEFDQLEEALSKKLKSLELSPHFIPFMDSLLRSACAGLDAEELKRLGNTLTFMANEKLKVAKSTKPKKKAKATLGAAGKVARRADYDDYEDGGLGAEFDDFM